MRTGDAPRAVPGVQDSLETALRVFADSELCKADVLIASFSSGLLAVGRSLRDRYGGELCFHHVRRGLMEIHEVVEGEKVLEAAREAEEEEDCTWCRARGPQSAGHGWKECGRLRKLQNNGKAKGRGRKA